MAFQGRALKIRLAIVLGLSMGVHCLPFERYQSDNETGLISAKRAPGLSLLDRKVLVKRLIRHSTSNPALSYLQRRFT